MRENESSPGGHESTDSHESASASRADSPLSSRSMPTHSLPLGASEVKLHVGQLPAVQRSRSTHSEFPQP